jgi:NADH-quinone oxidoreductase subunit L
MRRMGALRKVMPITAATFIVGWLAIAGVPPFSGFWSKDEILAYAYDNNPVLWALGLLTALLTAFYMSRQVYLVFFGEARWSDRLPGEEEDPHEIHPHESPWTMTVPLIVLSIGAAFGGLLNLPFGDLDFLTQWLEPVIGANEAHFDLAGVTLGVEMLASTVMALTGIFLAYLVYLKRKVDARRIELPVLAHGWYIDSTVTNFMGGPGRRLFDLISEFDRVVIDGAVLGVARFTRGSAARLRGIQSGLVRSYALFVAIGTALVVIFVLTQVTF